MDPRMGPNDPNSNCLTCGEGLLECTGHFAHIELARPVFHPGSLHEWNSWPTLTFRRLHLQGQEDIGVHMH
jgi:DNA-directed RNA polymerase beta' subunit